MTEYAHISDQLLLDVQEEAAIAEAESRALEDAWIAENRSRRLRNSGLGIVRAAGLTIIEPELFDDDMNTEGET